jgi:hypothetical protein
MELVERGGFVFSCQTTIALVAGIFVVEGLVSGLIRRSDEVLRALVEGLDESHYTAGAPYKTLNQHRSHALLFIHADIHTNVGYSTQR